MNHLLPLSNRTVFLDLNGVRAVQGITSRKVNALVESGELLWVFNVGTKASHALRFWIREVIAPHAWRKAGLEEVIDQILPVTRPTIRGAELGQWFLVSSQSTGRLGRCMGAKVQDRVMRCERERVADFLRERWLGNLKGRAK